MALIMRPMTEADYPVVQVIYQEGIDTKNATFETVAPDWVGFDAAHRLDCRLVAELDGEVVGWAALSPHSGRAVYAGVMWESVYIASSARGKGIGKALLTACIEESERCGYWTLQAGIFVENAASLALHRMCGFKDVGIREKIGQRDGVWRDIFLLERRSKIVGN